MPKIIIGLIATLLIPASLHSAHVLIWEYDTLDIFYDPVVGDSVDCPHWLEKALIDNGHTFETYSYLPEDLTSYDVVLVTLGWFRC